MTAPPRIGVLALQGDVREHEAALTAAGAQSYRIRSVTDLASVEAIVIPGGESTTMSKLALSNGLMDPLRQARVSGMPMYGSCAGMIMLADHVNGARPDQETVGGLDITVLRNAFGRQVDSFETDIAIAGIGPDPVHAVFIRAPWVESTGPRVEVLGTIDSGDRAGRVVAVRQGNLLATSFHPELTGDHRIHRMFVEIVRRSR